MPNPKVNAKTNPLLSILDFVKSYWPILTILAGIIGTIVAIPSRLQAVEKKAQQVEQRTNKIEQYIQAQERTQELIRKAPPGYRWNEKTEQFEVDPDYVPPPKKRTP